MMLRACLLLAAALFAAEMVPPTLIDESKVEPKYTQEARDAKLEGSVQLEISIDADGLVAGAKVLKPLGYGLDANAMDAVRQWRFNPATRDGKPVPVVAKVEVNFRLK